MRPRRLHRPKLVIAGAALLDIVTGRRFEPGAASEPGAHTHDMADVNGLTTALDAKADDAHTHVVSDVTSLTATLDGKAAAGHDHAMTCVTSLIATLDGKAFAGHIHDMSCVTNLTATIAGKAADGHNHAMSCVTSLTATLDGKAFAGHVHDAGCITTGTMATARLGSGATSANFLRGDQTYATPSGGSDPWTYAIRDSDFTTTSATAVDVTNLSFAPAACTRYEFEAVVLMRTATTTVNPRVGLAWPTGGSNGVAQIMESQAATGTPLFASGNHTAALLVAVGGLPNTTGSWPAKVWGTFNAGGSPSGCVRVQLASETAGTVVRVVTDSWLKYRTVA